MSNCDATFQDLLAEQLLKLFPEGKPDGAKNNININCPLCSKNGRPDRGRHMSICLGNNGKPLYFNCYKDNTHKGILTSQNLLELAWESPSKPDEGFLQLLDEVVKKAGNINKYQIRRNGMYSVRTMQKVPTNELFEIKRTYICKRLGLDLPIEELCKNKIIFSIKDLLAYNYMDRMTRSDYTVDLLDKYFVGFLTHNNGSIILRNMVAGKMELPKAVNERYIKYLMFQGATAGYYIIPSQSDTYKHIDIHMAEGTFDILSIFYNLRGANRINNVYASIGGNSYLSMIQWVLCDLGLIDVTFHIYIDMDIKKHVLPQIKTVLEPLSIEAYVHMNSYTGEKDFGVPIQKIKECSYRLV